MDLNFQLALPGSRPYLNGSEVQAPAQFYERTVLGGRVCGLWIGGERMFGVAISDPAGRPVGTIGPHSPHVSEAYDQLQRTLVSEALLAGPIAPALAAERVS
jgi:hypothetical protein